MFRFRKRKPVDIVIRVEDLQIGDVMQLTPLTCGTVMELIPLPKLKHIDVKMNNLTNEDPKHTTRLALLPELKVIAWR